MKNLLFIFGIVLVASFLRFYNISSNPPSLTWDEASWGYNAYSIGVDGRDEFGKFLPLAYLESFGDFKPPVYAYLSVLPVRIFGLNEFSTRFASAFFGVLTVLLTYFLVSGLFSARGPDAPHPRPTSSPIHVRSGLRALVGGPPLRITPRTIAILSSALLAISPWHILLSRAAFEANVATFFIALGVYLFLDSKDRKWLLPLSILSFVISMYTFNTARIVAPLLLLSLAFMNRFYILKNMRTQFITAVVVGTVIFLPLFTFLLTPQAKLRYAEVNIFSDGSVVERANRQIENDGGAIWSKALHNRRFGYAVEYLKHYFDNLSPDFLFFKGDGNPKFSIQDVGQLYIWEIPFFIAGIFLLFRKREGHWWIIPFWIIVGIIPAATARETPHALRIETILPTFQILTAYGIYHVWAGISNIKYKIVNIHIKYLISALCFLFLIFNISYFVHNYARHYSREFSSEWQYGYREAIEFTSANENQYDQIIFTEELGRPYVYVLFHRQYDPRKFRKEAKIEREVLGFVHVRSFGKYKFVKNVLENIDKNKNNLYIDTSGNIPTDAKILKSFNLLNGNPSLVAYRYE